MQLKYILALSCGFGLSIQTSVAQNVFTVGKEAVSKSEFLSWYQKNNSDNLKYDKTSLENFANLYALYKMKVMEANALQLDTIPEIKSDIEMYRSQLAKNYISDKKLLERLSVEAYDRTKTERNIAHIMLSGYGDVADAANKAKLDSIVVAINSGKITFEDAAKTLSSDRATATKGGALGYINAFQTPYAFETVAYQTPVGSVSKPFKSPYGYHLVKVLGERPASGTYQVAQILLSADMNNAADVEAKKGLALKIKQEAASTPFETLVTKYSEDDHSKNKKGIIPDITTGSTDAEVEKAVFSLKNPGDISNPIVTQYGVHVFKLIAKKPLGSYDAEKANIETRIERSRGDVIKQENLAVSRKDVGFKEHPQALQSLIETVNQDDFNRDSQLGEYPNLKALMFEIGTSKYTQQDFLKYVRNLTQGKLNGKKEDAFKELYRVYTERLITDAQMKNLEHKNPEFKKLATEYRNGVLIFDMMDKNIWSKANSDTAGLRAYYDKNASKYNWKPGFTGVVFQSKNHEALQQILTALQSGMEVKDALEKVNTPSNSEKIYQQTGRFDFEHVAKVDKNLIQSDKAIGIYSDGNDGELVILADQVYQTQQPKTYTEAREVLVDDYQKDLEKNWDNRLKAKYPLKLNTAVLQSMVK